MVAPEPDNAMSATPVCTWCSLPLSLQPASHILLRWSLATVVAVLPFLAALMSSTSITSPSQW